MRKTRVFIADDHALMRMGLTTLFKTDPKLSVVGEAEDGTEAMEKVRSLAPDIVILDLMMPGPSGAETVAGIKRQCPTARILLLTTFAISDVLSRALEAGADGALLKSAPNDELLGAIHKIASGGHYISDEVQELLCDDPPAPPLSPRQLQILESAARGLSNKQIADRFELKPDSIKGYFDILFDKLGVTTRAEAVAIALRKHLLKI